MPFKSKAQRRFFHAAQARHEIPKSTVRHWEQATEHVKKADNEEGTKPSAADRQKIRAYVRQKSQLSDRQFHEHAEELGVKPSRAEEVVYSEARALHGGKAEEPGARKPNPQQLAMGRRVESEHTHKPEVAREIARDHLAEIPDYYTRLAKMEREAKMKKSAAFEAGSMHALLESRDLSPQDLYFNLNIHDDSRAHMFDELRKMDAGERDRYLADMSARNHRLAMTAPNLKTGDT